MIKLWGIFGLVLCCAFIVWRVLSVESEKMEGKGLIADLPSTENKVSERSAKSLLSFDDDPTFANSEDNFSEIDPLFPEAEASEQEMAFIDPVGQDQRFFAEVTAHMSDNQLRIYRALKDFPVAREIDGTLRRPYELISNCKGVAETCESKIINIETNVVVFDGEWDARFKHTGAGKEVVRVK